MPKKISPLSARTLATLKPGDRRIELVDGAVPGLRVRMTPKGTMSWSLNIRDPQGLRRRFTVGDGLGLAEARRKAIELRQRVQAGENPTATRRAVRERAKAAQEGIGTLGEIVALYFQKGPGRDNRTADEMQRMIAKVFVPLMAQPASDVALAELLVVADKFPAPVSANRAVAYLRPVLRWASKRGLVKDEDWRNLERPNREAPQQRVLVDYRIGDAPAEVGRNRSGGCGAFYAVDGDPP